MPTENLTVLIVVPEGDPLGLLKTSVGGGMPPRWWLHIDRWLPVHSNGWPADQPDAPPLALLLSLAGTPDDIGMGRALRGLVAAVAGRVPDAIGHNIAPTFWILTDNVDGEYGGGPPYPVGIRVEADGVIWSLDLPDDMPDDTDAKIIAGMLAHLAPAYRVALVNAAGREVGATGEGK